VLESELEELSDSKILVDETGEDGPLSISMSSRTSY
jgi:hypothetical protein